MINPHKEKYHSLYWRIAFEAAQESVAEKKKVGAALVLPSGLISVGWNGTAPGRPNACEDEHFKTKPEVIHAEQNALDKLLIQGTSPQGSLLFVTWSPCFPCCKKMINLGIKHIYYAEPYKDLSGLDVLANVGVPSTYVPEAIKYRIEEVA